MTPEVSVIIPSRTCQFASKTVDDIFENAREPVEVIMMLDDWWPSPLPKDNPNLTIVHKGQALGMRDSINRGVKLSKGKYIMKLDDHCSLMPGWDVALKKHHAGEHWISIPSRYSLDPVKWERTRGPINYMYLTFPFDCHDLFGTGFHGTKWHGPQGLVGSYWWPETHKRRPKIDDLMIFQGSCYFMTRSHWEYIEGLDEDNHYIMYDEAIELDFKTWLMEGGRVIINKACWYAHLHKGKTWKEGDWHLSKRHKIMSEVYNVDYWMNNKWPKQTRPLKWLIDKFQPLDGWPSDWTDYNKYFQAWKHRDLYNELWGKE